MSTIVHEYHYLITTKSTPLLLTTRPISQVLSGEDMSRNNSQQDIMIQCSLYGIDRLK